MNDRLDLTDLEVEGSIWANKNNKQLRYDIGSEAEWLVPMSIYSVGAASSTCSIKRGQPVAIGLYEQLSEGKRLTADPCVVVADPSQNSSAVGIAIEPGNTTKVGDCRTAVHVQSMGAVTYKLSDEDDYNYVPPHTDVGFTWTYSDVGKTVYVSGKDIGELTLDITEAYYNNGKLLSVGRLVDAPLSVSDEQVITIDVQCAGDTRGITDSTEFSVTMAAEAAQLGTMQEYTTEYDKLFFVKLVYDTSTGKPYGHFITSDAVLSEDSDNSPIGAIKISPTDGTIALADYCGIDITLTRLGIISGNFDVSSADIGKDLYLSEGDVSSANTSSDYEYKVGTLVSSTKILIDCRFVKQLSSTGSKIGTVKPAYMSVNDQKIVCDPGFVAIDTSVIHKVMGPWSDDTQYPLVDFEYLIQNTMFKDIYLFSEDKVNWRRINDGVVDSVSSIVTDKMYFKFREMFYTIGDQKIAAQIKYTSEGAPEDYEYLWPEEAFDLYLTPDGENLVGGTYLTSSAKINITDLVSQGAYIDANGTNVESYEITAKEYDSGIMLTPGFYRYNDKWYGFEWAISSSNDKTYLVLVTNPSGTVGDTTVYYEDDDCVGLTWPIGEKLSSTLHLVVTVRRRPTEYHNLYLNQLSANNPWAPHTDGNNLVTEDTIWFGTMSETEDADSDDTIYSLSQDYLNGLRITEYDPKSDGTRYASIDWLIGPQKSGNLTVSPINKLYYRLRGYNGSIASSSSDMSYIQWLYDFDNNTASLSASFGGNLKSQSINPTEWSTGYIKESSSMLNKLMPFSSMALYKQTYDTDTDEIKFSISKEAWSLVSEFSYTTTNMETSVSVDTTLKDALVTDEYIDYQSMTSSMFKALCEASKRINLLEEYVFGADYEELASPDSSAGYPALTATVSSNSVKAGLVRLMSEVVNSGVVIDSVYKGNAWTDTPFLSYYTRLLLSVFSSYTTADEYEAKVSAGISSFDSNVNQITNIVETFNNLGVVKVVKSVDSDYSANDLNSLSAIPAKNISIDFMENIAEWPYEKNNYYSWNLKNNWGLPYSLDNISAQSLAGVLLDVYSKFGFVYSNFSGLLYGFNSYLLNGRGTLSLTDETLTYDEMKITPRDMSETGWYTAFAFDKNSKITGYGHATIVGKDKAKDVTGLTAQNLSSSVKTNSNFVDHNGFPTKVYTAINTYAKELFTNPNANSSTQVSLTTNESTYTLIAMSYGDTLTSSTSLWTDNEYGGDENVCSKYFLLWAKTHKLPIVNKGSDGAYHTSLTMTYGGNTYSISDLSFYKIEYFALWIGHNYCLGADMSFNGETDEHDTLSWISASTTWGSMTTQRCLDLLNAYSGYNQEGKDSRCVALTYTMLDSTKDSGSYDMDPVYAIESLYGSKLSIINNYNNSYYAPKTVVMGEGSADLSTGAITLSESNIDSGRGANPIVVKAVEYSKATDGDKFYHGDEIAIDTDDAQPDTYTKTVESTDDEGNKVVTVYDNKGNITSKTTTKVETNAKTGKVISTDYDIDGDIISITTTVTNKSAGTVVVTVTDADGNVQSETTTTTSKDKYDNVTVTITDMNDNVISTDYTAIADSDGNVVETITYANGDVTTITTDKDGNVTTTYVDESGDSIVQETEEEKLLKEVEADVAVKRFTGSSRIIERTIREDDDNSFININSLDISEDNVHIKSDRPVFELTEIYWPPLDNYLFHLENTKSMNNGAFVIKTYKGAVQGPKLVFTDNYSHAWSWDLSSKYFYNSNTVTSIEDSDGIVIKRTWYVNGETYESTDSVNTISTTPVESFTHTDPINTQIVNKKHADSEEKMVKYCILEGTLTVKAGTVSWESSPNETYEENKDYTLKLTKATESSYREPADTHYPELDENGAILRDSDGNVIYKRVNKVVEGATRYTLDVSGTATTINLPYKVKESTIECDPQELTMASSKNTVSFTYDKYEEQLAATAKLNLISAHIPQVDKNVVIPSDLINDTIKHNIEIGPEYGVSLGTDLLTAETMLSALTLHPVTLVNVPNNFVVPKLYLIEKSSSYEDYAIYQFDTYGENTLRFFGSLALVSPDDGLNICMSKEEECPINVWDDNYSNRTCDFTSLNTGDTVYIGYDEYQLMR